MASIDGIQLDCFEPGRHYEVGTQVGALLLAEGWAEPVALDEPALIVPFSETDPFSPRPVRERDAPPNLIRERFPPYADALPVAIAAAGFYPKPKRR